MKVADSDMPIPSVTVTILTTLSRYAEQNFSARLTALGRAYVAILEAWLASSTVT